MGTFGINTWVNPSNAGLLEGMYYSYLRVAQEGPG